MYTILYYKDISILGAYIYHVLQNWYLISDTFWGYWAAEKTEYWITEYWKH